jgi:Fic family protein
MHKIRVASWRDDHNGPMQVVSGSIGREKIYYQAPPATQLANEMKKFFRWWKKSLANMDGLLRAAVGHLWFVAIHPFEDGNGRIARTLNEMALAQDENLSTRYYSLSAQIMEQRKAYYKILERTNKADGEITEWILWFLQCMSKAILSSDNLLANAQGPLLATLRADHAEGTSKQRNQPPAGGRSRRF